MKFIDIQLGSDACLVSLPAALADRCVFVWEEYWFFVVWFWEKRCLKRGDVAYLYLPLCMG